MGRAGEGNDSRRPHFFVKLELGRKYRHQQGFFRCLGGPEEGIRLLCPGPLLQFTFDKDRINWVVTHFVQPGLKPTLQPQDVGQVTSTP